MRLKLEYRNKITASLRQMRAERPLNLALRSASLANLDTRGVEAAAALGLMRSQAHSIKAAMAAMESEQAQADEEMTSWDRHVRRNSSVRRSISAVAGLQGERQHHVRKHSIIGRASGPRGAQLQ